MKSQSAEALLKQLKNPFALKFVKCRVGATNRDKTKGVALFYIDAREVMKRLDEVCGADGWETAKQAVVAGDKVVGVECSLRIRMPSETGGVWLSKSDFGEPSMSSPLKGASSDALKRAAVNWGIGRYLYYIPNSWFPLNEYKKFVSDPRESLKKIEWANPDSNLEDWEAVAEMEYDPEKDIDLENLDFEDEEAEEILKQAKAMRDSLVGTKGDSDD